MFSMLTIVAAAAAAQGATPLEIGAIAAPAAAGAAPIVATARPSYGPNTRFCVRYDVSGSRILRKTCATRDQWLADGFDPLTAKRVR